MIKLQCQWLTVRVTFHASLVIIFYFSTKPDWDIYVFSSSVSLPFSLYFSIPVSVNASAPFCLYLYVHIYLCFYPHLSLPIYVPLSYISLSVYSACIIAISHIKLQGVEFLSALYQITLLSYLALFLFYNAKLIYNTKENYTHLVTRANKQMHYIKTQKHALVKKNHLYKCTEIIANHTIMLMTCRQDHRKRRHSPLSIGCTCSQALDIVGFCGNNISVLFYLLVILQNWESCDVLFLIYEGISPFVFCSRYISHHHPSLSP